MMSDAIGLEGGSLHEAALVELMSEIRYGLDKVSDTQASQMSRIDTSAISRPN